MAIVTVAWPDVAVEFGWTINRYFPVSSAGCSEMLNAELSHLTEVILIFASRLSVITVALTLPASPTDHESNLDDTSIHGATVTLKKSVTGVGVSLRKT